MFDVLSLLWIRQTTPSSFDLPMFIKSFKKKKEFYVELLSSCILQMGDSITDAGGRSAELVHRMPPTPFPHPRPPLPRKSLYRAQNSTTLSLILQGRGILLMWLVPQEPTILTVRCWFDVRHQKKKGWKGYRRHYGFSIHKPLISEILRFSSTKAWKQIRYETLILSDD